MATRLHARVIALEQISPSPEEQSMAYDEALGERIRGVLAGRDDVTEQRMFGGIGFMIGGRMAVGVVHDDLMVRVGPDGHDDAVARPHVRPLDH